MKKVIYTDLDGTLLDHDTYSHEGAVPALDEIGKRDIPLVFCTSKTRAETEEWRRRLCIKDPFIPENGGAIYIPKGYFRTDIPGSLERDGYTVIELGTPYAKLREALAHIREKSPCRITGFGDMTAEEIAKDAGLSGAQAALSKKREYDEAFRMEGCAAEENGKVLEAIKAMGLSYTKGGRYHHIMGASDKGKAVGMLTDLYRKDRGPVETIGLGDSANDFPMLEKVDVPALIRKNDGGYAHYTGKKAIKSDRPGSKGWNEVVLKLIPG
ncbi:MAG: mannosyl-3-phosphoglycerate phosphatase [Candidatus Altiarchaeota archaeon]|nr:mannosyl-3-phosphoglycerate phosphatase [Candidatus Altiarchaeota archaeon]